MSARETCGHAATSGVRLTCSRVRDHAGLHARLGWIWGDDGHAVTQNEVFGKMATPKGIGLPLPVPDHDAWVKTRQEAYRKGEAGRRHRRRLSLRFARQALRAARRALEEARKNEGPDSSWWAEYFFREVWRAWSWRERARR